MRHLNQGRKLNRTSAHRKALLRNLVISLIRHERISTTDAKAKELRRCAEKMITLGKAGDLAARRLALSFIGSRPAVKKLFDEIAPRFKERPGGYTRVVKSSRRPGDAAPLSIIEFVAEARDAKGRAKGERQKAKSADKQAAKA